jgi:xanthine dehydrogenase YagT iron-sulfur-binding subunit
MTKRTFTASGSDAGEPSTSDCCGAHPALSRRDVLHLAAAVPMATMPLGAGARAAEPAAATSQLQITVNGTPHSLDIDNRASLLDVLRETLGLTGTKKGCNQGACGACTVLVNGRRVVSCLSLAALQEGARIQTIEGLAEGDRLHPLQAAFVEHEGLQCGFCTAGQIMSGVACIAEGHAGSPEEIRFWMSGNICRCGAYPGIVAAVSDAAGRA